MPTRICGANRESGRRASLAIAQLVEMPAAVVEATAPFRALAVALDGLRREAVESRAAEAELRVQLDAFLAERHAFLEDMEVRAALAGMQLPRGRSHVSLGAVLTQIVLERASEQERVYTCLQKRKSERETMLEAELRAAQNELIRLRSAQQRTAALAGTVALTASRRWRWSGQRNVICGTDSGPSAMPCGCPWTKFPPGSSRPKSLPTRAKLSWINSGCVALRTPPALPSPLSKPLAPG